MMQRLFSLAILIGLVYFGAPLIALSIACVLLFIFPRFVEAIGIGILIDLLYEGRVLPFPHVPLSATVVTLVTFSIVLLLQGRLRTRTR